LYYDVRSLHIYSRPIIHPTMRPPAPRCGLARCSPRPQLQPWACGGRPATTALITPARRRRLPSHASDRRRSWSVTPSVWPAVMLASARHNGGGGCAVNPHFRPRPQLRCLVPPPWQPHCTVGRQVPGSPGKHAPGQGRRHPQMGKTLPRIWRR
jgi:hypothetical protein